MRKKCERKTIKFATVQVINWQRLGQTIIKTVY